MRLVAVAVAVDGYWFYLDRWPLFAHLMRGSRCEGELRFTDEDGEA